MADVKKLRKKPKDHYTYSHNGDSHRGPMYHSYMNPATFFPDARHDYGPYNGYGYPPQFLHMSRSQSSSRSKRRSKASVDKKRDSHHKHQEKHKKSLYYPSSEESGNDLECYQGKDLHSPNLKFCGASIPPLRKAKVHADGGSKRKILSGKHANVNQEVRSQEAWPHIYLDRTQVGEIPEYANLSFQQFFAGWTSKVLCEIDPCCLNTETENKVKHINRVATFASNATREEMLALDSAVIDAVEMGNLSWDNWEGIKVFHDRHMDRIRLTKSEKNPKKDLKDKSTFVPESYMQTNNICYRFQNGVCDRDSSHILDGHSHTVQHICGLCHLKKKQSNGDHGYKVCPLKKNPLF